MFPAAAAEVVFLANPLVLAIAVDQPACVKAELVESDSALVVRSSAALDKEIAAVIAMFYFFYC